MTRTARSARLGLAVLFCATTLACSSGGQQESAGAAPAPDPKEATSAAFDAVTKQKYTDDEFIAAIAALEQASGVKDASADVAAGHKRVLGIVQSVGGTKLPGVTIQRERLPEGVRIVRVGGFIEGTDNRHAMRFQLLALKYATEYNATMMRGVS
jgi:hypothetical protein